MVWMWEWMWKWMKGSRRARMDLGDLHGSNGYSGKGLEVRKSRSISFLLSFSLLSILYQSASSDLSSSPISPLSPLKTGDVHRT